MKKIFIAILVLISVQSAVGQNIKTYYIRLSANGTLDSGYLKLFTDSVFAYSDNSFVSFTREHYLNIVDAVMPNQFENFQLGADNKWRNFSQRVSPSGIATSTPAGQALLSIPTPVSPSLARINSDGTVGTRTVAQAKSDLGIDLVDNTADASKPVSTSQQTALNLKANSSHTHSESEVNNLVTDLAGKSPSSHTHAYSTLTSIPSTFTPSSHTHAESEVTNLTTDLSAKQATLVSGSNIKTINGATILGSTDIITTRKVASVDIVATASATTTTTLFTPSTSGMYRISIYLKITTTGTSPVAGPVTITYTEPDGSIAQSHVMALNSVTGTVVTTTVNNSTTTGTVNGTMIINAKTGVAIQYAIAVSGTFGAGRYTAHITIEAL